MMLNREATHANKHIVRYSHGRQSYLITIAVLDNKLVPWKPSDNNGHYIITEEIYSTILL